MSRQRFFRGTLILTAAGLFSRVIGFFYRIFLSHTIGAHGLGIYQLTLPLQMLVMAVCTSGIQTSISRICASKAALGKEKEAQSTFILGTTVSVAGSLLLSILVYRHAGFFAEQILKEKETFLCLQLLCFTFPLSAVHSCVSSYYYAFKKTIFPSFLQLLEQIVRVGCSYLLYLILLSENKAPGPMIAAGGALAGEVVSCLLSVLVLGRQLHLSHFRLLRMQNSFAHLKELLTASVPLTVNRVLLTVLSSIEVVLIPQMLRRFGLSSQDALSIYGVFTGMAMPLILFPSTITNSASVMLMPSVAQFKALGYQKRIRYVVSRTSGLCMTLGIGCFLLFFSFGPLFGTLLFHSPTAGSYIRTLSFMCPFLYQNTALSSILNGLNKPGLCLCHTAVSILIRIVFVTVAVPLIGIRGYLYGILLSELIRSVLLLFSLHRLSQV